MFVRHVSVINYIFLSLHLVVLGKKIGLFTPYDLTPGGGERYYLTSALVFQRLGYNVDLLILKNNSCSTKTAVEKTAKYLRVPLDFANLNLRIINKVGSRIIPRLIYDVFYSIDNFKIPTVLGIGTEINIYMCQFPFDLLFRSSLRQQYILSSYDIVLANSYYTKKIWIRATTPSLQYLTAKSLPIPDVQVLYPPVTSFSRTAFIQNDSTIYITVLGRFFRGRQSKGHDVALDVLRRLVSLAPLQKFHLHLIGNIHRNQDSFDYVQSLIHNISLHRLPATVITDADAKKINELLSKTSIYWHLTGILQNTTHFDPASLEHFGIAVVEAMSAGCIPIVLNRGGTMEIVQHMKSGFLCNGVADFVRYSLLISQMSSEKYEQMKASVVTRSRKFTGDVFYSNFEYLIHRSFVTSARRRVSYRRDYATFNPIEKFITGVVVEFSTNPLFEMIVRAVSGLFENVEVYHSFANKNFVQFSLDNIPSIRFIAVPSKISSFSGVNSPASLQFIHSSFRGETAMFFYLSSSELFHSRLSPAFPFCQDIIGKRRNVEICALEIFGSSQVVVMNTSLVYVGSSEMLRRREM